MDTRIDSNSHIKGKHHMTSRIILGIAAISLASCGAVAEKLRAQAANEMNCPEDSIQREPLGDYLESVTACGKTSVYGYDTVQQQWRSVTERASFDMSCPRNELTVQRLGGREVGVNGCGQKGVYIALCNTKIKYMRGVVCEFGGWSLNSASK
jgi:hypothetical protein